MSKDEIKINCSIFEENLTDYLDRAMDAESNRSMAAHTLKCPLCHGLLNDVKEAMELCREITVPKVGMTGLEAKILTKTMPQAAMPCSGFEEHLTDYLDGFLPANIFHRWERHAVMCEQCTDLPGEVVRSIAACFTYKLDELPLPEGLNDRILTATIGTAIAAEFRPSRIARLKEWVREISVPISVPQLAPVAMMLLFAFLFFSQTSGGSIGGMYEKSVELAGQTYQQGADIVLGQKR
jgi:anti-sigma factor RsiW